MVSRVPQTAAEVAEQLYARWNEAGPGALTACVDPSVELVCDPLRPAESALRGIEGARRWAARWDDGYDAMQIVVDGIIPIDADHALALVSFRATPRGGDQERRWAAAHLWTVRDGRVVRWESHIDLEAARGTLL